MDYREPDVMARRFVGTRRISDESGELYNREVRNVGILNHGSDDTTASECATGGTFRENPGGVPDGIGADGAEAVATVESQFAPPIKASAKSQITGRRRRLSARKASARRSLERVFIVFECPHIGERGGSKPKETSLVNVGSHLFQSGSLYGAK
jgi:hypothetical protein